MKTVKFFLVAFVFALAGTSYAQEIVAPKPPKYPDGVYMVVVVHSMDLLNAILKRILFL